MDNFNLIAFQKDTVYVQALGYDLAIDFDRDLAVGEGGGKQQVADAAALFDLVRLAVEQDLVHALV